MRKLNTENFMILSIVIFGIIFFTFAPVYLGHTNFLYEGYSYTLPAPVEPQTLAGVEYYANFPEQPLTNFEQNVNYWFNGFGKILVLILSSVFIIAICGLLYTIYDWLFPKIGYSEEKKLRERNQK